MLSKQRILVIPGKGEEDSSLVTYKHFTDLDDYIYDFFDLRGSEISQDPVMLAKNRNLKSLKRFDALDLVIIDIDSAVLPWQKKCRDLLLLFKMCKKAEKPVFAAGGGLFQLMYFCATGGKEL